MITDNYTYDSTEVIGALFLCELRLRAELKAARALIKEYRARLVEEETEVARLKERLSCC